MRRFPTVKWDLIIIDEAHNLRNVFHGTKRAKNLFDLSKGIPKVLLTATPLQNSLTDLHGLVSFIDPRIFGSEKVFSKRYVEGQDYSDLKSELAPVLYRTLRKDVSKYMNFRKRECRTVDFKLSQDEVTLYMQVNAFLKKDVLYSIPTANRGLVTLVIRKLLASSSFALIETFEVLRSRLEKLYEGTKSADAQEGFDLFWEYVEDEISDDDFDASDDEDTAYQKQLIQNEIISAIRLKYPDMANNAGAGLIASLTDAQINEIKAIILERLNIIKPAVRMEAEAEIDQFIDWWKLLAAQNKPLRYYVYKTDRYNRLMNYYGEKCIETEKATLSSMREVESASNMYYYLED